MLCRLDSMEDVGRQANMTRRYQDDFAMLAKTLCSGTGTEACPGRSEGRGIRGFAGFCGFRGTRGVDGLARGGHGCLCMAGILASQGR